jgi:methionyl aminopeptidase
MKDGDTPQNRPAKLPGPNEPCWCGSGAKYKKCHRSRDAAERAPASPRRQVQKGKVSPQRSVPAHIPRPDYAETGQPGPGFPGDPATRVERMRRACRAAAEVLKVTGAAVRPGITTDELDGICHAAYIERGGYPSTLNYRGFPKSLCTSVNEVILHGIPDSRPLEEGDIVNLDITIYLDGMHGDCSATFAVGKTDAESERLMRVTRECMELGIDAVRPGRHLKAVGAIIESHASANGFGVVRHFCGHGIGETFHAPPQVAHYFDSKDETVIEEGMFFTIEPMLTQGTWELRQWSDGWTIVTADLRRSAQYEHTILVTPSGAERLTLAD